MKVKQRRNGSLSIELLLVMPILLMMLGAVVIFGMILVGQQVITTASREGARAASIGGCVEAEPAVQLVLGGKLAAAKTNCNDDGIYVAVTVSIPAKDAIPDLLKGFGFSLEDIVLSSTTVMRKE